MEPPRQKWAARALLAIGVLGGLLWLVCLDYDQKVSRDVLDLIPSGERSPEIALARSLAGAEQARVALFALGGADSGRREAAAQAFVASLRASPAFSEAMRPDDPAVREGLGVALFARRFDLLLPGWLAHRRAEYAGAAGPLPPWPEWLAEKVAVELEAFLARPEAVGFQDLLPADPLLLVPSVVDALPALAAPAAADHSLVWARTSAPPLSPEGQGPVSAAVDEALATARRVAPGIALQWAAIGRFAAESRAQIESELSWLNLASLGAVLAIGALGLPRLHRALHLLPVVLGALLGAWVGTTLFCERVHILVFVVGSLLGGVAIDYGFYLCLQPPQSPGESYISRVGRLLKPLLASALTTAIGFSLLLASDLPLIRQLGLFVSFGLLSALATALLWFAQLDTAYLPARRLLQARVAAPGAGLRRAARGLLLAGLAVAAVGPWRLRWHDDIRELEALSPSLRAEAAAVRSLFGETPRRTVYLTRGSSATDARAALVRFQEWHASAFSGAPLVGPGLLLPTQGDWDAMPNLCTELAGFPDVLRAALVRHGFTVDGFEPFFAAWAEWAALIRPDFDALAATLGADLCGPLALTQSVATGSSWFLTIASHPPGAEPPADTATVGLDQVQSLNRLFSRYRRSALRLSAVGLGLVGLSVFAIYGLRRGPAIFALPAGSCLFAFGVLGFSGQPLNLFHLLGAFLGVCLSHNYAIFSAENEARGDVPPPSIRLSALTTAASFGVLALSRIPVVAALGTTVALIVVASLAAVELFPLARRRPDPAPTRG